MKNETSLRINRTLYFDILNILACWSVIILHHNGIVWTFSRTWSWRISLVVECVAYWAVPVFLMLTGATLLNYRAKYSTEIYLKKRIKRTVIPWISWSVLILIWKVMTDQLVLESYSIFYFMNLILSSKIESVYWFFPVLFGVYLSIPVLSCLVNDKPILWYMTVIAFVFVSCIPIFNQLVGIGGTINIPVVSGLIIFPILGFLLSVTEINRNKRRIIYVGGVLGTLFRYVYTYVQSFNNGYTDTSIKGYEKFYSVLLAISVFLFIKNINWNKMFSTKIQKLIAELSSYSFGIYLIHRIVMYYEMKIFSMEASSWCWRILFVPITYMIALMINIGISKIPIVKRIVGK